MNLTDLDGMFVVAPAGDLFEVAGDPTLEDLSLMVGGPLEEARTVVSGRRILFCDLMDAIGQPLNGFASNLTQRPIHGRIVLMPIDTHAFSHNPWSDAPPQTPPAGA